MFRISALGHQGTIQVDIYPSTITYDTLVRAGVECTSAFVSDEERIEGAVEVAPYKASTAVDQSLCWWF